MIHLGTAGWNYKHWRGVFYPRDVENELEFYSKHSKFNEVNNTFYRIPSESMIRIWYHYTPDDFIFCAKLNREITHSNKFKLEIIKLYFSRMNSLEQKLQSVLIQFPPRFKRTPESYHLLTQILEECANQYSGQLVLELRNKSWFSEELKDLLQERNIVLADTTNLSIAPEFYNLSTSTYYIRLLGDRKQIPDEMLGRIQLDKKVELNEWTQKLISLNSQYQQIFVVINNRFSGYAINDAIELQRHLNKENINVQGFENQYGHVTRHMSLSEFF
ncbi:MAG: DUF72 domain-containing protein [Candidatus Hodarchaeota archaeon]